MAEKHTIIAGDKVSYSGLFELKELFSLINSYFKQVGYDKRVITNSQQVFDNHKSVFVEFRPWKTLTDYVQFEIKLKISAEFEDVEIRVDDIPKIVQKGEVSCQFFAAVKTDYEKSWEQKAEYFFLRTLFNKFVYKTKMTEWDGMLKQQTAHLKAEISSFLNMNRFTEEHKHRNLIK